ncbi:MAG: glycerol-3-phosphate 1-O-acyltransferase PlsY [Chloroflexota bacterium]
MSEQWVQGVVLIALGYLIGSLPMGVIVARVTGGVDPRTVGSGRTGGTNALRAMGRRRALVVGLLDVAKGAVPILIANAVGAAPAVAALAGLAAVLGAWKSVFLRFGGGRGVATSVGGMLAISVPVALIAAPVFFGVIYLSRFVSLGSLLGTATGALVSVVFVLLGWLDAAWLLFTLGAVAIVWVAHRDNIGRLLAGTERRIGEAHAAPGATPGTASAPPVSADDAASPGAPPR